MTASGAYTNSSATTTSPSSATPSGDCPQCQINLLGNAGKGVPLVRFGWWSSTLGLTLDTISIVVTKYNNTAITATKTIHGDVSSLDTSTVSEALSIASSINLEANPEYNGGALPFILVDGTDGNVGNGVSFAYPTPYVEVTALEYSTITKTATQCPAGLSPGDTRDLEPSCVCAMTDNFRMNSDASYSYIEISSAYYAALDTSSIGPDFFSGGDATVDTAGFKSWLYADSSLLNAMPQLKSCFFQSFVNGPPALKIPVTALTATATSTVNGVGAYTTEAAKPQNSVTPPVPPQTSNNPAAAPASPTKGPSQVAVSSVYAEASSPELPPAPTNQAPPSSNAPQENPVLAGAHSQESQMAAQAPSSYEGNQPANPPISVGGAPPPSQNAAGLPAYSSAVAEAAPPISYGGATIKPDTSSNYDLPGVGKVSPGGLPVTTNNVVYSLAPSATAIISNGQSVALTPVSQPTIGAPNGPPILTFAGSTYTAESSNYVIGSQTLKPGAPAIVASGIPISLASGGGAVLIGSSTQRLATPEATPPTAPALTLAGSPYTVISGSQYVIGSQTLTPGGIITVSGTPISLGPSASVAVVGISTQQLAAPPVTKPITPVLTFAGSTYTADSTSEFVIASQTLSPGGAITVSGTPISLGPGASVAIVGTSTQQLSPTKAAIITFGGSTYTANSASDFVIASQTLTPGGALTIGGTPISYAPGGSDVVIGSSTEAVNMGAMIMGGFGSQTSGSAPTESVAAPISTTSAVPFTGDGRSRARYLLGWELWGILVMMGMVGAFGR